MASKLHCVKCQRMRLDNACMCIPFFEYAYVLPALSVSGVSPYNAYIYQTVVGFS